MKTVTIAFLTTVVFTRKQQQQSNGKHYSHGWSESVLEIE